MNLKHKPDFERAAKMWDVWWEGGVLDRPPVVGYVPKSGVWQNLNGHYRRALSGPVSDVFDAVDKWMDGIWFEAESVPFYAPDLGPDQFAAFLGARFDCPEGHETSWAYPVVGDEDWDNWSLELDEQNPFFQRLMELSRELAKRSAGNYAPGMIDFHSNLDALSALRGPQDLAMDLLDDPDAVGRAMDRVRKVYPVLLKKFCEAAGINETTGNSTWIPFWSRKPYAALQCDFLGMIGPELARKYVWPAIEEEAACLGRSIFHLDGVSALHHLDDLLKVPGIDGIQWVPGAGQPGMCTWIEVLQKIQKAGKKMQIWDCTIEEAKVCYKHLKPEGVAYCIKDMTHRDEVSRFTDWLEKQ